MPNPVEPARLSSIVFLGDQFTTSMFDERTLFEGIGQIDNDQLKTGPIGQFSYQNGCYQLWITPPRIDVRYNGSVVLPDELTEAACRVADVLKPSIKAIPVRAIGINCDALFEPDMIGQTGEEFCGQLSADPLSRTLIQRESFSVTVQFSFEEQRIRYTIKIDPQRSTKGRNLIVAVNGHQEVVEQDDLDEKLNAVQYVRDYVRDLHIRIGGGQE